MKIAFLNIYNGFVSRGAERSTEELASRLSKNHQIYVIAGNKSSSDTSYKTIVIKPLFPNIGDSSFSFLRKFYLDIWSLQILIFTLFAIPHLWRGNFDIIVPINGGWQSLICKLFTNVKKVKMVIIGRAGVGRDDAWNLFFHPDVFVALTASALKWAEKMVSGVRVIEIPNGVDMKKFCPSGKAAKLNLQKPRVFCAAAFFSNKRIDLTIKAVAKLKKYQLIVAGDGPMKAQLQELGEKLLGKERFVIKDIKSHEMPKYYRAADIFTLASDSGEAFGNVYLEAMATNLPVVATDDSTRKEIVGNAGLYVNPWDIDEYAKTLDNALKKSFDRLPLKQVKKFSWDKIAIKYEKLFITLMNV